MNPRTEPGERNASRARRKPEAVVRATARASDDARRSRSRDSAQGGDSFTASQGSTVLIDLHSHSTASDGQYAAAEVAERASAAGVSVWALTDHDSVAALGP